MSIDQHVPVTVSVVNTGIALTGFGRTAVLSYKNLWSGRSRIYAHPSAVTDMLADGYEADDVEVLSVKRIMAQSPHPKDVKIIKGTRIPTMRYELVIEDAIEGQIYSARVVGEGVTTTIVSYTAVGGDDEADIAGELITQLQAVVDRNFSATVDGSDPDQINVVGTAAGDWFSIEIQCSTELIRISMTHADPGIADDLGEILLADSDWYYLDTNFNSEAMILEAADFIESAGFKAYIVDSCDSDIENTASPGTDIASQLNALGYKRTLYSYHRKPNEDLSAGWEGRVSPLQVGTWDAAYKSLVGVSADAFTPTQMANMDAKKCSYYKAEAGRAFTWNGAIANTDYAWFDVTVSLDFVIDLLQKRVLAARLSLNKVAYTDEDIQGVIKGAAQGALDECKSDSHKIIALGTPGDPDDPEPIITFQRVADIDPSLRSVRELPPGNAVFRLQGAVNIVPIDLTVTF
jgi:hypothetical protein